VGSISIPALFVSMEISYVLVVGSYLQSSCGCFVFIMCHVWSETLICISGMEILFVMSITFFEYFVMSIT
jgi:hypothetical protein